MEFSLTKFALSIDDVAKIDEYRRNHKAVLLTMVLTDIVGYSALCERLSDADLMRVIGEFEDLTSHHFEKQKGGLIVKRIGDAALVVFAEPVSAVLAALEFHKALETTSFSGTKLEARTGIHMGQVTLEQKGIQVDIFGRHVNRVARVQTEAKPGEILVTDAVEDNVRTWIADENKVNFYRRRTLMLKGIENPVDVYTVEFGPASAVADESRIPEAYIILDLTDRAGISSSFMFDPMHDRRPIVGRTNVADIVVEDPKVSRKHLMIIYDNSTGWTLQDLESSTGVLLNGARVDKEMVLEAGDVITLGDAKMTIRELRIYPVYLSNSPV